MLENDALVIYSQGNYFGIDDRRNLKSLESINVAAEFQWWYLSMSYDYLPERC